MSGFMVVAKEAAKKASEVLLEMFEKGVHTEVKADNSFVTDADLASEKIITDLIKKNFPDHSIYAEESGLDDKGSEYVWYIDPLDGTHNYAYGFPLFGVSIGLARRNEFILGVISVPYLGELFYAEKGKGAFLNGKKIHVSDRGLDDACFASTSSLVHHKEGVFNVFNTFGRHCGEIKVVGSVAVVLAYIAAGRIDYHIKPSITPYDPAAGKVILEEAGGKLTKTDGAEFKPVMDKYNFIASNGKIHDEVIKIYKEEFQ